MLIRENDAFIDAPTMKRSNAHCTLPRQCHASTVSVTRSLCLRHQYLHVVILVICLCKDVQSVAHSRTYL